MAYNTVTFGPRVLSVPERSNKTLQPGTYETGYIEVFLKGQSVGKLHRVLTIDGSDIKRGNPLLMRWKAQLQVPVDGNTVVVDIDLPGSSFVIKEPVKDAIKAVLPPKTKKNTISTAA